MIDPTLAPFAALAVLQVKHLLCDYYLQSNYQVEKKSIYGHPAGFLHAGLHALFTVPVFLIYPTRLVVALAILALEFAFHYHVDWAKGAFSRPFGWTAASRQFWWAIGTDQFLHQISYLAMVLVLAELAT